MPFTSNVSVSNRADAPPAERKSNRMDSPPASAYRVIWNIGLLAYGPNGGEEGVSWVPRTSLPT